MRIHQISIISMLIVLMLACDGIFDTNPSDDDSLFQLQVSHSIEKIIDFASVDLKWDKITIENFYCYKIEKRQQGLVDWQEITILLDRFQVTFTDTIWDDEDLEYRVGIIDTDENVRWAEDQKSIPPTSVLSIPEDYSCIQAAFTADVIDDGDSIIVAPGDYIGALALYGKDVLIKSIGGPWQTVISPEPLEPNLSLRTVTMGSAVLKGFTITLGLPNHGGAGGGVFLSGTGTVMQCLIYNNTSHGFGGGVFITDSGNLINNLIYDNVSDYGGSGLQIQNAHGKIINNTIIRNTVVLNGNLDSLKFYNNIIYCPEDMDLSFDGVLSTNMMDIDYSCFDFISGVGSNNISGYPGFYSYSNDDFTLQVSSMCYHTGHPDSKYNNLDGSRNSMGAYGGPYSLEIYGE